MAATVALVGFLVLLFGGLTLMLTYGYLGSEQERAKEQELRAQAAREARTAAVMPDFLAPARGESAPLAWVIDDAFVSRIENHVRAEQALVAQFVSHPSIDNLYRHTGTSLHAH